MPRQHAVDDVQPRHWVEFGQDGQAFFEIKRRRIGDDIGQMTRGIDAAHKGHRFLGYFTEVIDKVINLLFDHFHQGFDIHVEYDFVANHMGAYLIVGFFLQQLIDVRTLLPFEDNPGGAIRQLHEFFEAGGNPYRGQRWGSAAFVLFDDLFRHKNQQHRLLGIPSEFQGPKRLTLTNLQGHRHLRHDDHFAEDDEGVINGAGFIPHCFISHCIFLSTIIILYPLTFETSFCSMAISDIAQFAKSCRQLRRHHQPRRHRYQVGPSIHRRCRV